MQLRERAKTLKKKFKKDSSLTGAHLLSVLEEPCTRITWISQAKNDFDIHHNDPKEKSDINSSFSSLEACLSSNEEDSSENEEEKSF